MTEVEKYQELIGCEIRNKNRIVIGTVIEVVMINDSYENRVTAILDNGREIKACRLMKVT